MIPVEKAYPELLIVAAFRAFVSATVVATSTHEERSRLAAWL